MITYHSSPRHSPYPSHSATPIGPLSRPIAQSTSIAQETSDTVNPASSMFNSITDASHEMDIDAGHATLEPQSTEVSKNLSSDLAILESGIFSFFLLIISLKTISYSTSKQ